MKCDIVKNKYKMIHDYFVKCLNNGVANDYWETI